MTSYENLINDESITMLPMSTYDQYTSLLILESRAWMLCDTLFGVVSDFELTKTGIRILILLL